MLESKANDPVVLWQGEDLRIVAVHTLATEEDKEFISLIPERHDVDSMGESCWVMLDAPEETRAAIITLMHELVARLNVPKWTRDLVRAEDAETDDVEEYVCDDCVKAHKEECGHN